MGYLINGREEAPEAAWDRSEGEVAEVRGQQDEYRCEHNARYMQCPHGPNGRCPAAVAKANATVANAVASVARRRREEVRRIMDTARGPHQ